MVTSNIQLLKKLALARERWIVTESIDDYENAENMFSVIFLPLCDLELSVHHIGELLRIGIVCGKETFFLFCIHTQIFFNVLLDRIPHMVYIYAWTPRINSFKAALEHVQDKLLQKHALAAGCRTVNDGSHRKFWSVRIAALLACVLLDLGRLDGRRPLIYFLTRSVSSNHQ